MKNDKTLATRIGIMAAGLSVVFAGTLGMPKEADAFGGGVVLAEAAREIRLDEGLRSYIATQNEASLQKSVQNGLSSHLTPYAAQCRISLETPENLKPEDVTKTLRNDFVSCLKGEALIAQMSATTPEAATKLGMDSSLSPYFSQCQKESGIAPGDQNTAHATKAKNCMENKHWEDIKSDILVPGAIIVGGLALAGVSYKLGTRNRYY